ncbi:MAG: hypothetical protein ACE5GM_04960 [bacterium]
MSLLDFNKKVGRSLQDEADILSEADIDNFILEALSYYSKDRPRVKVTDISGDGGYEYDLPSGWDQGFSTVKRIEYPAGERIPVYLESTDWMIYTDTGGKKLRLLHHTPSGTEVIRVTYTCLYDDTEIDLIPAGDQDAFCSLAASLCCGSLARYYSQTSAAGLEVEVVDYPGKAAEYAGRAKELLDIYNRHLGKGRERKSAASVTDDWDTSFSWQGDFLSHPKKNR